MPFVMKTVGADAGVVVPAPVIESFATAEDSATTVVVTKPSGTVDGDLLLAFFASDDNENHTVPAGFTVIAEDVNDALGRLTMTACWRIASSEGANYTFICGDSQDLTVGMLRISGHHAASPIDVSDNDSGESDTPTAPTVTATYKKGLLIAAMVLDQNTSGVDPPDGMAEIYDFQSNGGSGQKVQSAAAQQVLASAGATGVREFFASSWKPWIAFNTVIRTLNT